MKKIKFEILGLLAAALLAFGSCETTSVVTQVEEVAVPGVINSETYEIIPSEENVKLLGRSIIYKDQVLMVNSSTGAAFDIEAKRLDVTFAGGKNANSGNKDGAPRVCVFVNGERLVDQVLLSNSSTTFTVFDSEETVTGLVQVIKVSEAANSMASIQKIVLDKDGKITPAAKKDLKIEFIGDSITCGYGVDDNDKMHHFKTATEDNSKTYAYKTAQNLDADYSMFSASGWGIVSAYTGDGTKNINGLIPRYYSKLGYSYDSFNGFLPQDRDWNFSVFQPDFVIVNLGTNDAGYTRGQDKRIKEYQKAYIDFLKAIRKNNPNATIVCTLGIMGGDLYPAIQNVVSDYIAETGDTKVSALRFANQNEAADGIGADWHPSEKTHEKAAKLLSDELTRLMNK